MRLVRARHQACGASTRVRLPGSVPARAVRRVVCDRCSEPFEAESLEEVGGGRRLTVPRLSVPDMPRISVPETLRDPQSRTWRYGGVVVAGAIVIVVLLAINGNSQPTPHGSLARTPASGGAPPAVVARPHGGQGSGRATAEAKIVHGANFTLALPAGWKATDPPSGAAYAAGAGDGGADVTLWIEQNPKLDFAAFESRSVEQLKALAGSAQVVSRVPAPTPDATVVTLAADTPASEPQYEVTLRVAGPYRYYLATTVEPDASAADSDGVELIHNSFVPVAGDTSGAGN